ncbi:MAG: hypothetical protein JSR66_14950 [Proteobacteria bacterium]|nr:hypothetical protein [Pseudomonadota bacterium]
MISRSMFLGHRAVVATLVLLSVLGTTVALANDETDPPGRVARLSYVDGSVSLQPAGVEDWADATINRPLTTGDKLWADQNSRAELDMGSAAIRLGSNTGLSFLNLDDQMAQLNVTAGTAIVHVRDLGENQQFEIDTPNVAVLVQSPGDYRVEVNDAGNGTVVKVANGDAQVSATGQTVPIHTQQAFAFSGTNQVDVDQASVGAPDALDSWSIEREHRSEQAREQNNQYLPPDVAGGDDLAQYGTWESTPDYGDVWTPTVVAAGWTPYQDGRWVWVSPWGWTWVDAAPWGFVPFHYGRWAYRSTRWCWVPGPRHVRPVYAPALVGWVGSPGASVSITVGGGPGVGWFPLAPREVYVPGYRVSNTYVRNVNVTNTTIVNNTYITNVYENKVTNITYANRGRPGAVVSVSRDTFVSGRSIAGRTMRIPPNELARFNAHGAGPAIAPSRESVLGHRPDMNVRRPPAAFMNRPVVARTAPPPAPVSFDRQQAAIRENGGRPLGRPQLTALQSQSPTVNQQRVRVVAPSPIRPIQGGQRFGTARPENGRPEVGRPGNNRPETNMQERERSLHATPIPPSQQNGGQTFRTDRPPGSQMRNDQYRMQNNGESRQEAQEARPTPRATPIPQGRPFQPPRETEQSRPAEQPRPTDQPRTFEQSRPAEQPRQAEPSRNFDQFRQPNEPRRFEAPHPTATPQATPVQPPRPIEQPRAVEQPRAIEPPRAAPPPRPVEQPRVQLRPMEAPRPVQQQPQARPAEAPRSAPPPQRNEDRRGRPDPRK